MGWLQKFWPRRSKFLPGYSDAKYTLLVVACIGELLQGGLVFGWNALALMLTARGTYSSRCNELSQRECPEAAFTKNTNWALGLMLAKFMAFVGPDTRAVTFIGSSGVHQRAMRRE